MSLEAVKPFKQAHIVVHDYWLISELASWTLSNESEPLYRTCAVDTHKSECDPDPFCAFSKIICTIKSKTTIGKHNTDGATQDQLLSN